MIPCDFVDFESTMELAYNLGRTPLISDTSLDEKVCTYFRYQPDVLVYDAQAMVASWAISLQKFKELTFLTAQDGEAFLRNAKFELIENLRRSLVQAMKFGKLLAIRLGTSAPDFMNIFSDEALGVENSLRGSAYFPLIVFERGGFLMREPTSSISVSSPSQKASPGPRAESKRSNHYTETGQELSGRLRSGQLTWAERLFREEDMRPHKNVSFCR
jgi:hypothetical protein